MAKNNNFINNMSAIYQRAEASAYERVSNEIVPVIYSAIAIALYREGFDYDHIDDIFAKSQKLWTDFRDKPKDMIKLCEEETGISLTTKPE